MIGILKTTLKLLFRNVGFWLCVISLPILSTVMLSIQQDNQSYYYHNNVNMGVLELESIDEKVAYYASDIKFVVKVYDASESELSDYMLDKLAKSGMFKVGRAKAPEMTKADADEKVLYDGQNDRMGAALYIDKNFDEYIKNGEYDKAITIYVLSDDDRIDVLNDKLAYTMQKINAASTISEYTNENILSQLGDIDEVAPEKSVTMIASGADKDLTKSQIDQKTNMGYAFVFMTLGFVLVGTLLASTVIKEINNDVLKRIKLTGKSEISYFAAKFVASVFISLILSGVLTLCTLFIDSTQMGLGRLSLMLIIFLMGLIFCTLSLFTGVLVGNVMGATITSFTVWCLSSMLSGLYFPLGGTSKFIQSLSEIMPQKWFVDGTVMLFLRDKGAWTMLLCVTVAYLFVFLSLGSVGLKLKGAEE